MRLSGWSVVGLCMLGCTQSTPTLPQPAHPERYWVERSDAELAEVLTQACVSARAQSKPIRMVFSAPWCIDCRQTRALEHQPLLARELENWVSVVVHVGRLDRHRALLDAFDVSAIAHWVTLAPSDCAQAPTEWPVLRASSFEPVTGWFSAKTEPELRDWLVVARGG